MINPNDPAFPGMQGGMGALAVGFIPTSGLTKREYFAAMAMQGIVTNNALVKFLDGLREQTPLLTQDCIASFAVQCSDALIAELSK